jgi:hypothetical protein
MLKAAAALAFAVGLAAQPAGVDVDAVLERLDDYLETYEGDLGSLIADEDFRQSIPPLPGNGPRPQLRHLESEVAFLRLPGGAEWFGFRRAKRVDGKPVGDLHQSLANLLSISSSDTLAQAKLLVVQSSEHNLGLPRTINMPTLPLELLSGRYRHRFEFKFAGKEKIRGRPVNLVDLVELGPEPIIYNGGYPLQCRLRAWVDVETGALWRAEVVMRRDGERSKPKIRVDFALEPKLQVIVPVEMREEFGVANIVNLGTGVAKYSNYRRFQTSARIVPPPP